MNGMTLKKFLKTLVNYDEIEFSCNGVQYNFQKENSDEGKLKISVWQSGNKIPCYNVEIKNNLSVLKTAAQNLINAKIFPDGKSIAEAEKDIEVEFFT